MNKLILLLKPHGLSLVLILAISMIGGLGVFWASKLISPTAGEIAEEIDLPFDPEGPFALLIPRRDGNALNLNLKRTASYDAIAYDLVYNAEGIDRGVSGEVNTSKKKGEYDQEILFGSCSKNVCKYDKGVERGTLTLRIKKGNKIYKMNTQWHFQRVNMALGVLTSGDDHFTYSQQANLEVIGFSIINDLSGVPKLPGGRAVFGKVYALNVPIAKNLPGGAVSVELVDNPPSEAKLYRFDEVNGWKMLDTKVESSKIFASTEGSGIFAVLIDSK